MLLKAFAERAFGQILIGTGGKHHRSLMDHIWLASDCSGNMIRCDLATHQLFGRQVIGWASDVYDVLKGCTQLIAQT